MKHLLIGVAVVAVLAFSAPAGAQPYTTNPAQMPPPPTSAPPAAMAPSTGAAPMVESTSAMPPSHRHVHREMAAHHRGKGPQPTGGTADQLNQEELAHLQAGNMSMPATPPAPGMAPPPPPPASSYPGSPGPKASGQVNNPPEENPSMLGIGVR